MRDFVAHHAQKKKEADAANPRMAQTFVVPKKQAPKLAWLPWAAGLALVGLAFGAAIWILSSGGVFRGAAAKATPASASTPSAIRSAISLPIPSATTTQAEAPSASEAATSVPAPRRSSSGPTRAATPARVGPTGSTAQPRPEPVNPRSDFIREP